MHRPPCPPTPSGRIGDEITGADQRRPYPFLGRSIGPASGDFPGAGPLSCPCARWGKPYGSPHARPPRTPPPTSPPPGLVGDGARGGLPPSGRGSCRRPDDRPRAARPGPEKSRAGERAPGIEPGARCCREHEPGTAPVCQRRSLRFGTIGTALPFRLTAARCPPETGIISAPDERKNRPRLQQRYVSYSSTPYATWLQDYGGITMGCGNI